MAELTPDAFAAMMAHMNDDHADANAAYARHYGGCDPVVAARMVALDAHGMTLEVDSGRATTQVPIAFERAVTDTDDARDMLVAMAKAAATASPGQT